MWRRRRRRKRQRDGGGSLAGGRAPASASARARARAHVGRASVRAHERADRDELSPAGARSIARGRGGWDRAGPGRGPAGAEEGRAGERGCRRATDHLKEWACTPPSIPSPRSIPSPPATCIPARAAFLRALPHSGSTTHSPAHRHFLTGPAVCSPGVPGGPAGLGPVPAGLPHHGGGGRGVTPFCSYSLLFPSSPVESVRVQT
jgi:hypothetical protein